MAQHWYSFQLLARASAAQGLVSSSSSKDGRPSLLNKPHGAQQGTSHPPLTCLSHQRHEFWARLPALIPTHLQPAAQHWALCPPNQFSLLCDEQIAIQQALL